MSADSQRHPLVGYFLPLVTVTPVIGKVVGFSLPTCCTLFGVWSLTLGYSQLHNFSSCHWINIEKTSKLCPKWVAKNESINALLPGRAIYFSLWCTLQHIKKSTIKSVSTQRDLLPQLIFFWYWEITCTLLLLLLFLCLAFSGRWHSSLTQTQPRKRSIGSKWNLGQPSYKSLSTLLKCWLWVLSFLPKRHHLIFNTRRYQCNNCSH